MLYIVIFATNQSLLRFARFSPCMIVTSDYFSLFIFAANSYAAAAVKITNTGDGFCERVCVCIFVYGKLITWCGCALL